MNLGIARSVFERGFVQADRARQVARSRFALCIFELLRVPRRNHSIAADTKQRRDEGQNEKTHRASDNHRCGELQRAKMPGYSSVAAPSSAACQRVNI